jgi:alpha-glucosidase (family GH31 glycosyl hydrolase)
MITIPYTPIANQGAIVLAPKARFTVLTSRLIRLEYSPDDQFNDQPSQIFWYRQQPVPEFEVLQKDNHLEIVTKHLLLRYDTDQAGFNSDSLSITLTDQNIIWHHGDSDEANLRGTYRTLDETCGPISLEAGLMSRAGWAVVDDSRSLIFNEQGWLEPRPSSSPAQDIYFFGYGHNYQQCLRDYSKVVGSVPLLPRWSLGNWWSRYWSYTQAELTDLMRDFQAHNVPLAVCIVDMDWHLAGWTGYTWNKELFPNPPGFMAWLHQQGLKIALNLHPADGVGPHEAMYPEMARRMGIEPASKTWLPFDIATPQFAQAYFEVLHHPQEAQGVDFWWIDWQQGQMSSLPGLDPLWYLNHLHFYDLGRPNGEPSKRPFIFSRWGGLGNHRYPIGFSGDTQVNWKSLAFQPYFTATAANVGYGWWSHDIGGHMKGVEEPELYARWVQFGTFSPIFRLHSTKQPFHERRPWGYDAEVFRVTRSAMQLRHALIPYLYTMAWRNVQESLPLIQPMYHLYPQQEEAYHCPQQYTFGSELIAAPFTSPADPDTRLSRQVVWLPEGNWYNFFSGEHFAGDAWYTIYGRLEDIPVFARAGAIVPLGPKVGWGGLDNPAELHLHIFAGADNRFILYEDDGETNAYQQGAYSLTSFEQLWQTQEMRIRGIAVSGDTSYIPEQRNYSFYIHGIIEPDKITVQVEQTEQSCQTRYDESTETLHISGIIVPQIADFSLNISTQQTSLLSHRDRTQETCLDMLWAFKLETTTKTALAERLSDLQNNFAILADYGTQLQETHKRALLEVTQGVGVHCVEHVYEQPLLLLWNNQEQSTATYQFSTMNERQWVPLSQRFQSEYGKIPIFKALQSPYKWRLEADYFGMVKVVVSSMPSTRSLEGSDF